MHNEDQYMKDPRTKTSDGMIAVIEAMRPFVGKDGRPIIGADHDVIYLCADTDSIPEDSAAGLELVRLGCHIEEGESWAMFV